MKTPNSAPSMAASKSRLRKRCWVICAQLKRNPLDRVRGLFHDDLAHRSGPVSNFVYVRMLGERRTTGFSRNPWTTLTTPFGKPTSPNHFATSSTVAVFVAGLRTQRSSAHRRAQFTRPSQRIIPRMICPATPTALSAKAERVVGNRIHMPPTLFAKPP